MWILLFCVFCGCTPSLQTIPWQPLGTPEGQSVTAVFVDTRDPSVVYCGSSAGEFLVSSNRGKSWMRTGTIPGNPAIYSFFQHPDDTQRFYVGTGSGLFVTHDAGVSWQEMPAIRGKSPHPACRSITADAWNPLLLYAGFTGHGLFGSKDGGATWVSLNGNLDPAATAKSSVEDIIAHPSRPDLLFAVVSAIGAVRSTDGGSSWLTMTERFDPGATTIERMIVHPENPELCCIGTGGGDIYRTQNGGMTWGITQQGTGYAPILNFASDPEGKTIHAATVNGLLSSDDFGGTWTASVGQFPHLPARVTTVTDASGTGFYLYGGGAGVRYLPADRATWVIADSGLSGPLEFSALRILNDGNSVIAAAGASVFRHNDSGWVSLSEGLPGSSVTAIVTDAQTDSLWYAATASGPYHTTNGGKEWKPLGTRMGGKGFSFIAVHPAIANRLIGMTESGMMVSTDNGASWSRTKPPLRDYEIRSMTFHPANAGIVGAGTSNNGALVSNDGGITWDESRYGLEGNEIIALTFVPEDQQTCYAWGSDGKGYVSTNKGIEWGIVSQQWLPSDHIILIIDTRAQCNAIALVNRKDLYHSGSGGNEWVKLPVDPPQSPLTLLSWSGKTRTLYGVSAKDGLYRISLGKVIDKATKK